MQPLRRNINPFALMLDPQAVIAQIERSERLEGLHRRICRPLDKPLLGGPAEPADEAANGSDLADAALDEASALADPDAATLDDGARAELRHDA